ncbi:hypothetical protein ARMGADRAFT_147767 [Armillaria gallica]|uniref:Uncharacterized protein n=1 Tax=Armillaria gallica TaxID=47427 RepID=A0A2H3E080_ARMGA|nr:hypothetical protein ARMGADRAFT_147767 [Armillaria gallica]
MPAYFKLSYNPGRRTPFILYAHGSTTYLGGFLDIRFEHHLRLAERSRTSGPYSAIPPPAGSYLCQSEEKGILDRPLPVGIVHNLGRLQQNLLTTIICIKAIFGPSEGTGTLERGHLTRAVHDQLSRFARGWVSSAVPSYR